MVHINRFRYEQAIELIERARDVGDLGVIRACAIVLESRPLGRRIDRSVVELIDTFFGDRSSVSNIATPDAEHPHAEA